MLLRTPNSGRLASELQHTQRHCIICQRPTTGSVGAAGIRWPMICQPCKDAADNELRRRVTTDIELQNRIMSVREVQQ